MKVHPTLDGIRDFLAGGIESPSIGINEPLEKLTCKRFFSLLYWDLAFQQYKQGVAKTHVRECVADASSSYYLLLTNLYKPSMLCLRSGIENCLRTFCLVNGRQPESLNTVPNLVSEARAINLFDGKSTAKVNELYRLYSDLCEAVHSSNEQYLQKKIPFQDLISFEEDKALTVLSRMETGFKSIGELLYLTDHAVLSKIDPHAADFVRDNVSRTLKRAVAQAD